MTIKMYQITNLPSFIDKVKSQKLPFKTAYHIALLSQEIDKHIAFYQEKFRSVITEYSKKDQNGNPLQTEDGQGILLMEEYQEKAVQEINELSELEVELPDFRFSPADFGNIEFTPEELSVIIPFIKE